MWHPLASVPSMQGDPRADDEAAKPGLGANEPAPARANEPADEQHDIDETIANARRRHGAAGAIIAAGMLGLDKVLGRKPREEAPIVISTGSQPIDIDDDGIVVQIDEQLSVVAPPQPRPDPFPPRRRTRRKG